MGTAPSTHTKTPSTIVIVEDDECVRNRIVGLLNSHPLLSVADAVGTCADAKNALATPPDVALVDLGLPDGSGIDLIREFHSKTDKTEFMVFSIFSADSHIFPALKAGASGYLLKDTPLEEIPQSILNLLAGGSPISPNIARKILHQFQPEETLEEHVFLTPREKEVLEIMAKGFNHTEAAELLNISYHTLISHVKNIYGKLAVNSRTQALFEAKQMGLV